MISVGRCLSYYHEISFTSNLGLNCCLLLFLLFSGRSDGNGVVNIRAVSSFCLFLGLVAGNIDVLSLFFSTFSIHDSGS